LKNYRPRQVLAGPFLTAAEVKKRHRAVPMSESDFLPPVCRNFASAQWKFSPKFSNRQAQESRPDEATPQATLINRRHGAGTMQGFNILLEFDSNEEDSRCSGCFPDGCFRCPGC
jgi:hypothetical protein